MDLSPSQKLSPNRNPLPLQKKPHSPSPSMQPFSPTSQLHKMLGKKLGSMKKLTKKSKVVSNADPEQSHYECLLRVRDNEGGFSPTATTTKSTGTFVVYVGGERQRFVVPTSHLSHPLFKILLEKASNEFGFNQRNGLVVPCSVNAFQEVINAVECCNGRFDFGELVDEFL
ncbi:hypothetical protein C2S52_022134 [Perilla frutescens var. hirtella]|nr:hypothetical protein C2S52_022134 [Perilla frutescens var. hirtella]